MSSFYSHSLSEKRINCDLVTDISQEFQEYMLHSIIQDTFPFVLWFCPVKVSKISTVVFTCNMKPFSWCVWILRERINIKGMLTFCQAFYVHYLI